MSPPPPSKGIRHIALFVRDLPKVEAFYRDVLGYVEEWRPSADELYMTSGADNLALHQVRSRGGGQGGSGAPSVGGGAGGGNPPLNETETHLDHFGLLMPKPEDVDAWAAHLEAHGVPLDTRPRTHRDGARSFYARDPEGNRIQFIWHPPIAGK